MVAAMDGGTYILAGLMIGVLGFLWTIHRDMRNLSDRVAKDIRDQSERTAKDMRNLSDRVAKDIRDQSERTAKDMRDLSERMTALSERMTALSDRVARLEGLFEGWLRRDDPPPAPGE